MSFNGKAIFEDSKMRAVAYDQKTGKITLKLEGEIVPGGDPEGLHLVKFGNGVYELHGWSPPAPKR